jgi:D-tyrosyl-tRNA(Tyr) deacylase
VRALVQRVTSAQVEVDGRIVGEIGAGLLVLLGVGRADHAEHAARLAQKVAGLRCFADASGAMNKALLDTGGAALVVSQFTLYGDTAKGHRPSFVEAAPPARAEELYRAFVAALAALGVPTATGVFRAHMAVSLVNDGPVTLLLAVGDTGS